MNIDINTNFYKVADTMFRKFGGIDTAEIVDLQSFIDAGKKASSMSAAELEGAFIPGLVMVFNQVFSISRSYEGMYKELYRGTISPNGNTIELILHKFMTTQAAVFTSLTDGQSVDQYIIKKPDVDVRFYTKSNVYDIMYTIEYDQMYKSFESPEATIRFWSDVRTQMSNTNEATREAARIALVADVIARLTDESVVTPATDEMTPSMRYKVVTLYNELTGANFANYMQAIHNREFNIYLASLIKQKMDDLKVHSVLYNTEKYDTFTREEDRLVFLHSKIASLMNAYIKGDGYNPGAQMITDYISVPFWQDAKNPFIVKYKNPKGEDEITSPPVACVIADKMVMGEYMRTQVVENTPYNARGRYWDTYLHCEFRYMNCEAANAVIFTLD